MTTRRRAIQLPFGMEYQSVSSRPGNEPPHPRELGRGELASGSLEELERDLLNRQAQVEAQARALEELQRELQAALRRHHELYDHLPIGCVTLARNARIHHANLTAAAWLRCPRERLAGTFFTWFLDAFDAGRLAAHLGNCLDTGTEQQLELTLRLENGLLLTVQLASRPVVEPAGEERLVHTAILHVAKVRQTPRAWDDLLREQQALEQAIARELRAPLTMVSQHARDALHLHGATISGEVRLALERMQSAAVRAETTLQQLLDHCALSHESVTLDLVNVDELVQHVLIERRAAIAERGAEILVNRPLPCVRAAHLVLGQVLSHLLAYALKAAHNRPAPRFKIEAHTLGDRVVLTLTDPGLELSPGEGEHFFRVFERAENTSAFPGSGVPLALVRHAVERMGGRVWIASTPGSGSAFHLEFAGT